jgi:hypothetical protein
MHDVSNFPIDRYDIGFEGKSPNCAQGVISLG